MGKHDQRDRDRVEAIIEWLREHEAQINRPDKGEINFSWSGTVVRPTLTITGSSFKIQELA